MRKKQSYKKLFMILFVLLIVITGVFWNAGSKSTLVSASREEVNSTLEFLKEGYNAYWYLDDSLDMENVVNISGEEYLKVIKNFNSSEDIENYFARFYSENSTKEFMKNLSPKMINGSLYVIAGEAGDKPNIDSAEIVDENLKKGYITLKLKDSNKEDLYLRAYVSFENNKLKITKWEVL
ncbi:DL-endopeptidase inhibitor IseA family protein [Clostridium cylindrosporum]|uniref:Uncharacterized protein n=1 Tax=Clostridium cylindrosporum DSM 605 TaxID=1121307 RepID=A0A0J8DB83_CLOCY|nr:DL-endopeptidase inhibitor IseA family protein [Clostridium cylindrosporum]KMT23335.1 hypothetical protein CLCY_8c00720 [Clostridium cylindrosporum DSM 605]